MSDDKPKTQPSEIPYVLPVPHSPAAWFAFLKRYVNDDGDIPRDRVTSVARDLHDLMRVSPKPTEKS